MAQAAVIDKCDLCESKDNVDFFCVNCDEILCASCKVGHAKSKATKDHQIIPLSQAKDKNIVHSSKPVLCGEHSTVEVTLFCIQCDCLVCTQCLAGKHKAHNITVPDEIRDSKVEELNKIIKRLREKKSAFENAFDIYGQAHSRFLKSVDQVEKEISDQKAKIIEELNIVCDEQFSQVTKLRQDEGKKYSEACNEIQVQNQAITSALQTAEKSIVSNNTAFIIQTTVDTTETLQGLEDPTTPAATTVTYQYGDRSHPAICRVQGKVNIEHTTAIHQPGNKSYSVIPQVFTEQQGTKPKLMEGVQNTINLHAQKASGDNRQQQRQDVNNPRIDVNKVKVKSTITLKDRGSIHVIIPLKNKTAWVKAHEDTRLSLLDSKGKVISKSVSLGVEINDAKEYRDGLLVTCLFQHYVVKMSADGKSTSTFSDLSPYETKGLCVTHDLQVMVCLRSTKNTDSKVVRLNSVGDIIQTIKHDVTGVPLYIDPRRVISLTTGEVVVVDWRDPRRIIGVDHQGQHLFTWEGEILGRKLDKYSVTSITNDSNNNLFVTDFYNHRVYVLGKDGSGAICLLDKKQCLEYPQPVAVDNEGQLWVGCYGKIHILKY